MRYSGLAVALAGIAACEPPTQIPDVAVVLMSEHVWSRGDVLLTSPSFRPQSPLPTVSAGNRELSVRRVDDSTVAAALFDTSGLVTLRLRHLSVTQALGPVTVAGFRDAFDGPRLSGYVLPWPRDNPIGVLGAGDSGAVLVDLRFNVIARQYPESLHSPFCAWGVGPSPFPGRVVFYGRTPGGTCRSAVTYQLGPPVVPGDTLLGFPGTWVVGELGRRRSLSSSDTWLFLMNCDTTPCQWQDIFGSGSVTGVTLSPRGGRVVFENGGGHPPMVLDPRTMRAAFTLPRLRYAAGAAFSPDGDTVWVTGPDSAYGRQLVVALDATTGSVQAEIALDPFLPTTLTSASALAIDPEGPWLYVGMTKSHAGGTERFLLVLDRRSLAVSGVLAAPHEDRPALVFERIVPMPGGHVIYLVTTAQGYDLRGWRARVYRFDRVP